MESPLLISFSGLDGSGKSTQISVLRDHLETNGLRVVSLAFWDDVVVGKGWREGFVHRVYGSERGVGAPGKPVARRDKNVRKWYLSMARHLLYAIDAVNLSVVVGHALRSGADAVILDRYIYDELANLPLRNPVTRLFIRAVHAVAPRPNVAYLLDVDVEAAVARKPEYPVDFMYRCRIAYFELDRLLGTMTVIPAGTVDEMTAEVLEAVRLRMTLRTPQLAAA